MYIRRILTSAVICMSVLTLSVFAKDHERGQGRKRHAEHFSKMDKDGDGAISSEEWRGKRGKFEDFDTDRNGRVTREELANTAREHRFRKFDTNNDGSVSREEWRGGSESFSRRESNNDGVLSRDELSRKK